MLCKPKAKQTKRDKINKSQKILDYSFVAMGAIYNPPQKTKQLLKNIYSLVGFFCFLNYRLELLRETKSH